jgi:hypothetical protein
VAPWVEVQNDFASFYERIRANIFLFCEAINFKPTSQQKAILACVQTEQETPYGQRKRRIAVKSGQGPGKTALTTVIALWRQFRNPGAWCVIFAPKEDQAKNWLKECTRTIEKAPPFLKTLVQTHKKCIYFKGVPNWVIEVKTAACQENAAGIHHPHLTVIMDEACGVDREIVETLIGTVTQPDNLLFMIGNPTTRDSSFFDCFNQNRHLWHTFTLNAEESPIVDPAHIAAQREQFGADSDVYKIRVLGEFPSMDPATVISSEDMYACTKTNPFEALKLLGRTRQIGIDLARYGNNESVIYRRSGGAIVEQGIFARTDPSLVVANAFRMQKEALWTNDETLYMPDAGGMGQGVMHLFHNAGKNVTEFHSEGKPLDGQFKNAMTEAYFMLAKFTRSRGIHVPNDNRLIQQASARKYKVDKNGKIILESKEDFAKEHGEESPDRADALALAFYNPIGTGRVSVAKQHDKFVGVAVRR